MIFKFQNLTDNNYNLFNFPLTRFEGTISKLELDNAAYLPHKTDRMYKKVPRYSDKLNPD